MHHPTDRIAHTTAFVTPVVEHWLEHEIAQRVHHEGSIWRPIAPSANALTTELHFASSYQCRVKLIWTSKSVIFTYTVLSAWKKLWVPWSSKIIMKLLFGLLDWVSLSLYLKTKSLMNMYFFTLKLCTVNRPIIFCLTNYGQQKHQ